MRSYRPSEIDKAQERSLGKTRLRTIHDNNLRSLAAWKENVEDDAQWFKRLILRLHPHAQPLSKDVIITSPHVDSDRADVFIRLYHTPTDKLWCWFDQAWTYLLSGFSPEHKPILVKDLEWYPLMTVVDRRYLGKDDCPLLEDGTRIIEGTGPVGLCEYDLEQAVSLWFKTKGFYTEVTLSSAKELL